MWVDESQMPFHILYEMASVQLSWLNPLPISVYLEDDCVFRK
jgi:hypothetical protein